ncbi:signal peptidase II [Chitinispirillales bacterium ANBcel5]|uniref:signal peptidase II n=1 Tax=Cellulosispirillum alkaliphilum TaxID=3039283 RepID=UPI002A505913|nr:signal peptidase II [Chitinispirillales bacterium ANBcel5]
MGKIILKHKWLIMVVVAAVGFFLDWYTKHLAESKLTMGVPVSVIGEYFQFLLVYNRGALFGFNPANWISWFPTTSFFLGFSVIAVIFLLFYYRSLAKHEIILHWGLVMILPGALGNMFDRIIHPQKGVIDFLKVGISQDVYWPIFNLADVYLTIGIGLILLSYFKERSETVPNHREVSATSNSAEEKKVETKESSN